MNYEKIIKELEAKRKYWETKYKELERTHQDVIKDYEQYCNVASKEISRLRTELGWDKK